jgi:hypothetical protein
MQQQSTDMASAAIEIKVRELVVRERIITFTALTTTFPDCRWVSLFRALNHLEKQRVIQLTPLPGDYQICLTEGKAVRAAAAPRGD